MFETMVTIWSRRHSSFGRLERALIKKSDLFYFDFIGAHIIGIFRTIKTSIDINSKFKQYQDLGAN